METANGSLSVTILLVDDHAIVRSALRDWIGIEFPETRVLEANSGEEALALIENDSPHLVLMDITLPGMNGLETTQRLKSIVPSAHIVMFTVHDDQIYRKHAFAAGASAYVPKRAIRSELMPTVGRLLPKSPAVGSVDSAR